MKTKKHYTALELAEVLGITKSAVHSQYREGKIEAPAVLVGNVYGWSEKQVKQIKQDREAMLLKLMESHIESRKSK